MAKHVLDFSDAVLKGTVLNLTRLISQSPKNRGAKVYLQVLLLHYCKVSLNRNAATEEASSLTNYKVIHSEFFT